MENQPSTVLLREFLANPRNRDLFGNFARKYQPTIKQCCLRRGLQDADAEDLTANILLRFCKQDVFDGFVFESKQKFRAWLETVAKNAILTFLRDRGRKPDAWSIGNAEAQDALQRVAEDIIGDLEAECVEDRAKIAIARGRVENRVEKKTWQAFCMLVDEKRTVDEVAAALGMSRVAVWTARSRTMKRLREELRDLHYPANENL